MAAAADDAGDDMLFEMDPGAQSAASTPSTTLPSASDTASSRGGGAKRRSVGGKAAKGKSKMCIICRVNPVSGHNSFCKADKKEYEGLRKDAVQQGKVEFLERAMTDPVLFKKILEDYREKCCTLRTSSGWARPSYDFTRVEEMIRMSTVVRTGGKAKMKDYFDVVGIF